MPKVRKIFAQKVISDRRMAALECKHLDESYIRQTITEDTVATDEDGRCVFVFLKGVIPSTPHKKALRAATGMDFQSTKNSNRCALKGNGGWELNFGWSDTKQRFPKELRDWISKHDRQDLYSPVRLFAPTLQQYDSWVKFKPLVRRMDAVFRKHARHYWLIENRRFRSRTFGGLEDQIFGPSMEGAFRLFKGVSISTATLLKSAPTAVHKDSANADAGLTCLTTLGEFTGGSLLFPQFGLELPVQPGDLIIAATHRHWHCNVRKRVGTRYSLITYYRERLVDKLAKALLHS